MKTTLVLSLIIIALHFPATSSAQVWKCPDGSFTNIKPSASRACVELKGGAVCGTGRNRFISKGDNQLQSSECPSGQEESSPFVNFKKVESLKREAQNQSSAAKAKDANKPKEQPISHLPTPKIDPGRKSGFLDLLLSYF